MLNPAPQDIHPTIAQLRRLRPLGELDIDTLQQLADKLTVQHARKGSKLLSQGDTTDHMLFLLDGTVMLEAMDGGRQRISANEDSARTPVARLRPSRYDVICDSTVEYLTVPSSLLSPAAPKTGSGLELYEVVDEADGGQGAAEDQLAYQLYEDLKSNQLLLPSLPDVAIRVGQAVNHDLADAHRVARVIENDPVMTAKLIKVANSARYAGRASIAALPDAIARIGLNTTHSLVITFALRELFRCNIPSMYEIMRDLWQQAREVAAICHILAPRCSAVDPESALLAGLVHNIGGVVIITYARDFPELTGDPKMVLDIIDRLKGQLGKMVLQRWDFPPSLVEAAVDDSMRSHEGACDMGDLVIVARQHVDDHGTVSSKALDVTLPAYTKLGIQPEDIQLILEEADAELRDMLALLGD